MDPHNGDKQENGVRNFRLHRALTVKTRPHKKCKYVVGATLGSGNYAEVREGMHVETKQHYALKAIKKKLVFGREDMIQNEIQVLQKLSQGHENILTLVDYFETDEHLYLVTDLCLGSDLFDRVYQEETIPEESVVQIVSAILRGVAYLHSHGVVHRDLKAENILFRTPPNSGQSGDVVIADFGMAKITEGSNTMLMTMCGTPGYMAPEMLSRSGHGKAVDMWAVGVLTYFALGGYTPFDRATPAEEQEAIRSGQFDFLPHEYWVGVSDQARDFICQCLQVNPADRLTVDEAFCHPFLTDTERTYIPECDPKLLETVGNGGESPQVQGQMAGRRNSRMSSTMLSRHSSAMSTASPLQERMSGMSIDLEQLQMTPVAATASPAPIEIPGSRLGSRTGPRDEQCMKGCLCSSPESVREFPSALPGRRMSSASGAPVA